MIKKSEVQTVTTNGWNICIPFFPNLDKNSLVISVKNESESICRNYSLTDVNMFNGDHWINLMGEEIDVNVLILDDGTLLIVAYQLINNVRNYYSSNILFECVEWRE